MSPANNIPENDPRQPAEQDPEDVGTVDLSGNAGAAADPQRQPVTTTGIAPVTKEGTYPSDADFEAAIAGLGDDKQRYPKVDEDRAGPVEERSVWTRLKAAALCIKLAITVVSTAFAAYKIYEQILVWTAGMNLSWLDIGHAVLSAILTILLWLL